MKFLVSRSLEELNYVFSELSSKGIVARAENYSLKPSRGDKRLEKHLDAELRKELSQSPELRGTHAPPVASAAGASSSPSQSELEEMASASREGEGMMEIEGAETGVGTGTSPRVHDTTFGDLIDPSNRKAMIHLIEVLNSVFPDYDFTLLRAHHFERMSLESAVAAMDDCLRPVCDGSYDVSLRPLIERTMEDQIEPADCEVYSYIPDESYSLLFTDAIWSYNMFLYNRNLRRVMFLFVIAAPTPSYRDTDNILAMYNLDASNSQTLSSPGGLHTLDLDDSLVSSMDQEPL